MSTLTVNDLQFEVRRSALRRVLEITVDRGGELILSAPPEVPDAKLRGLGWTPRYTTRETVLATRG